MKLDANRSILLIIDLQERLLPAIEHGDSIVAHAAWLIGVARELDVPVLVTEHYRQGVGATADEIGRLIRPGERIDKIHFSAVAEGNLLNHPVAQRKQWVVCGTESHVCVQQTVLDLLATGRDVAVVEDAVGSRKATDKALALARMRQFGAQIVSREMVAFEWLHRAGTDIFRTVLKKYIR